MKALIILAAAGIGLLFVFLIIYACIFVDWRHFMRKLKSRINYRIIGRIFPSYKSWLKKKQRENYIKRIKKNPEKYMHIYNNNGGVVYPTVEKLEDGKFIIR